MAIHAKMARIHCALMMTGSFIAAPAASAQDGQTEPAAAGRLEEIVVTAQKVEQNQQKVPVAVTTFSSQQLQMQNVVKLGDIGFLTPGATVRESLISASAISIAMRGQTIEDSLATLDNAVGVYVDGYIWARAYGLNADLLDVSNVQVLKGPQGTLFGRNTTGGAMLVETNDPELTDAAALVSATYGRFDQRSLTAVVNAPLAPGLVAVRGAFRVNKRDGYVHDALNDRTYNNQDDMTGRVKLLVQPTDTFSVLLSGEWYQQEVDGFERYLSYVVPTDNGAVRSANAAPVAGFATIFDYINAVQADPDFVALDTAPFSKIDTQTYVATAKLESDIGTWLFVNGYRDVKDRTVIDTDGSPYPILVNTHRKDLQQWSSELQLTGTTASGRLDYALGATYFTEDGVDQSESLVFPPALNPNLTVAYGDIDNKSWGAYGQTSWHFTDKLTLTSGLRYSWDEKGLTSGNKTAARANGAVVRCSLTATSVPDCFKSRSDSFDSVSYTLGLDYQITSDVMVYAKTSKGYRAGAQNLRAQVDAAFVPTHPEVVYSHELGLKSEFFDQTVRLNLAAYSSRLENAQRSVSASCGAACTYTLLQNAATVEINGIEAELTALLFDGFQLGLSGTVIDPKYLKYIDPLGVDHSRDRFQYFAESSFATSAQYSTYIGASKLIMRADYAWSDDVPQGPYNVPSDPFNNQIIANDVAPAAGTLGARVSLNLNDPGIELSLWGKNLLDDRKFIQDLFIPSLGYMSSLRRPPASYGVTATYRF